MAEISLMIGHVLICPVAGCGWMTPMLDHDLLGDHLLTHEPRQQTTALEVMVEQIRTGGEPRVVAEAVMFRVESSLSS